METKPVIEALSAIPIGTVITWAIVICGIITAIVAGIIKLYKTFEKYREYKEEDEEQKATLKKHDEILTEIQESLQRIEDDFKTDHELQKRRLKHDITESCNEALHNGSIKLSTLKSIKEMYEDYLNIFDGNSWVHTLIDNVEHLSIDIDIDDE